MHKGIKILGWIAGFIVLLLLAATVAIKLYLTKDRVLAWVVPPLQERLHRKVSIADVGAGLTGLHLDGLEVRAEGAPEALVSAGRVQVDWNLWSLLSGTVEVLEVRLVEPRIHVVRRPDGTLDIDDLTAPEEDMDEGPAAPEPAGTPSGPPLDVVVRVFALQQGAVSFEDQSTEPAHTYVLDGIDARVTEITLDSPIPYELTANLPFSSEGRFRSEGTVNAATRAVDATLGIHDLRLEAWNGLLQEGTRFAGGELNLNLVLKMEQARDITANGSVTIAGLELARGNTHGTPSDLALRWQSRTDLETETAGVNEMTLTVAEQVLKATVQAAGWSQRTQVRFDLESDELRLDPILAILPAAEDAAAAPGETATPQAPPTAGAEESPAGVPLDAQGDVTIGTLYHGEVEVRNIAVHVELRENHLRFDPVAAELYGGRLAASAQADLVSAGPAFEAELKTEQIALGDLLADASPKLKNALTGTGWLEGSATGRGGDLEALTSTVKLEVKDGKMVSHPLVREFAELFKIKEYESLNFYSLRADVGTADGVAAVNSLVFSGPRMQATGKGTMDLLSTDLDMQLAVALPREVAKRIIGNAKVLDVLTDSEGWTRVPMRLSGQAASPRYAVDSAAVEQVAARLVGEKGQQLLEDKVMKKLPVGEEEKQLLDEGIKSLFNR